MEKMNSVNLLDMQGEKMTVQFISILLFSF